MNAGAVVLSRTGPAVMADFSNLTGAPIVGDTLTGLLYWLGSAPFQINKVNLLAFANSSTDYLGAFTRASTALGGAGEIYVPPSTTQYPVSGTIALPAGQTIRSEGKTAAVLKSTNTAGAAIVSINGDRATVRDIGLEGTTGGGDGIAVAANVGYARVLNTRIVTAQRGVAFLNGNYLARLEDVEAVSCRSYGYRFDVAATVHNGIRFEECFANGCADSGFSINNSTGAVLTQCASDACTNYGFELSSSFATLINCTAETNTLRGFSVTATGLFNLIGCRTFSQLLPFSIFGSANVNMIGIQTSSTPSGNSLELSSAATGANTLIGQSFDAGIFVDGKLTRLDSTSQLQLTNRFYPSTDGGALQNSAGLYGNVGAPNNANGANGDFYLRSDGGALTTIYQRRAGAWVGIV